MFITDLKTKFYEKIRCQRVLVFVAFDVDALCAWRILQYLLQCDHVLYTLIPVMSEEDLIKAYEENEERIKHIILINCGININLLEVLQPQEDTLFFVIDSHRPINIHNFYNITQIHVVLKCEDDYENIPEYEDIFCDESDNENESGDESDGSARKRKRLSEDDVEKRRERRLWKEKKESLLMNYEKLSYYGPSSAVTMFNLAWKISKDNNELLWWAIVGLTEQFINNKIDSKSYILECSDLQNHVTRHNPRQEDNITSIDCLKIAFDKELSLALYRHWSLQESIKHTMYTVCKFKLWTLRGKKRLNEFLADLGLPLAQVSQKFGSMDMTLRCNVKDWIEDKAEKYGLDQIVFGSFHVRHGFRNKFSASDVVYAATALLESTENNNKFPTESFHHALDCLSRTKVHLLHKGLDLAKTQLEVIGRHVQTFVDTGAVLSTGPFLFATVPKGNVGYRYFSHASSITNLAQFLLQVQVSERKKRKIQNLPMVLSAPADGDDSECIIVGIPPISANTTKNFFGKAFETAAAISCIKYRNFNFDSSIIVIKTEYRGRFIDSLINLLH